MPTIDFATDFLKTALSNKEKIDAEINDLRKQESETTGPEKYKLFEKRQPLNAQLAAAKEIVLIAENGVQTAKNNGEIIPVYTDKKGKQHLFVPDFRKVDTTTIIFDEETILTEPAPKYIPKLDEELLKRKSFVLDAMRIDKDTYIVSIGEHREEQGGYVILTLDQLVLTSDYYLTKAKATNTLVAKQRTQRQEEYYDKLSEERTATGFFTKWRIQNS